MYWIKAVFVLALTGTVNSHMQLGYPAPLLATFNPFTGGNGDYDMTTPLASDGSNFPCRGALKALGTDQAQPVVSWTAGQRYNLTVSGGAPHGGGSCQAAISSDQGKSFTVIHTWTGNCPALEGPNSSFDFRLPSDTPSGEVIFAWTWFNKLGNREMYMNCASIEVTSSSNGGEPVAFKDRPSLFIANINGCRTADSKDVIIPNPGPDVTENSSDMAPPVGDCEATSSGSGDPAPSQVQSSPAETPTTIPSGSNDGSGESNDPATTTVGSFFTTSLAPVSNPTSSVDNPDQTGSDSGDVGYQPGNDWPEGFSSTGKVRVSLVSLALLPLFAMVAIE